MTTATRARRWTHDAIVEAAHLWKDATGDLPAQHHWNPARTRGLVVKLLARIDGHRQALDLFDSGDFPSDSTVRAEFGSWAAFTAALGTEPRPLGRQPREITERRLRELRQVNDERPPATGGAPLKAAIGRVIEAQREHDRMLLRGALYELAAVAVAWMDQLDEQPGREAA